MYEIVIGALIVVGIITIIGSFYREQFDHPMSHNEKSEVEQDQYEEYGARISEINGKLLELNEYGDFMKSELDQKHKELLFLYQLINEKSKEAHENTVPDQYLVPENDRLIHVIDTTATEIKSPTQLKINHNKMILQLSERGYDVKEIAQMLQIGQGEVKLVLNLFE